MTMTTAAAQVDLEPPVLDEPALAEDIVEECGLGSFPASDPPQWTLGVDPHVNTEDDDESGGVEKDTVKPKGKDGK